MFKVRVEEMIWTANGFRYVKGIGIDKRTKDEAIECFDRYANRFDLTEDEHYVEDKTYIHMSLEEVLDAKAGIVNSIRQWVLEPKVVRA